MPSSISETVAFAPSRRSLRAILQQFEALGPDGGGALTPAQRHDALRAYDAFGPERGLPPAWRHDYAALAFDGLHWSTGRVPVPAARRVRAQRAEGDGVATSLAVANAGGIVHSGGIYLAPQAPQAEPRVVLMALADAKRAFPERLTAIHQRIVAPDGDRFAALSSAFQNCGVYVDVPDGVALDAPLQVVWASRPGEAAAVFPHAVIRIGRGARATIVERHVAGPESFVAGIVEIELGEGARLDYVVVQHADEDARICTSRAARCGAGATIAWHLAELGATLSRSVCATQLAGDGARADVNAFFFAQRFRHMDLRVSMAHAAEHTHSHGVVRSAVAERGKARFASTAAIPRGALRCVAALYADALVLSRDARFSAEPAFDIDAGDASAYQASTVGSLDEEQLFYVQTRGIARGDAQRMIALAFFEAAIARFPGDVLRREMRTALDARLDELPETFTASAPFASTSRSPA